MAEIIDPIIYALCVLLLLVIWRWLWLRNERRGLARMASAHEAERFDPNLDDDEDDKTYSGRVVKRLRVRVVEGRVEIHWEYHPGFIHRGFVLTAKSRMDGAEWQPAGFEPYEDSGSWIESFKYGEIRSYVFIVKKQYRFFFGLLSENPFDIVYDQISFSVRKGRFHKEKAEHVRDRKNLLVEVDEYAKAERAVKKTMGIIREEKSTTPLPETPINKLEKRLKEESDLEDYIERRTEEINRHPSWSEERKKREVEKLQQMRDEMGLE